MATIIVRGDLDNKGPNRVGDEVTVSEVGDEGLYTYQCTCGDHLDVARPLEDAIQAAGSHIDHGAPGFRP